MKLRLITLGWLMLFVVAFAQAQSTIPTFIEAQCPMELPETLVEGQQIICGYLIVLENRANPNSGTIRIAVAILKAKSANPQPDPIVFLTGGPGQSALGFEEYWSGYPTLENRDFILIDPRGTGFSEPDMDCSEISFPILDIPERAATKEELRTATLEWTASCRDLLISRGIDLGLFNTAIWAADVADLRAALDLDAINLYGISYGAYWALAVVRDIPDGIRSITLDSVSPPPIDHHAEIGLRANNTFNLLFEACANDMGCAARFPTLSADFQTFVEHLQEQPVRLPTTEISWMTDTSFISSAYNALYFSNRFSILPLAMEQLSQDNWEVALQLGAQVNDFDIGTAVFNSVICHDEIPFTDKEVFAASIERFPYLANWLYDVDTFIEICAIWGAGQAGIIETEAIVSDVPSLILAGTFDPTTPPDYGRVAAQTLKNSIFVEFPTLAHAVTFFGDCPRTIMTAFVNDPNTAPNETCIANMEPISFMTDVMVNRGIFQIAKNFLLEVNIPVVGFAVVSILSFITTLFVIPVHVWRTRTQRRIRLARIHLAASWLLALVYFMFILSLIVVIMGVVQVNEDILLFGLPGYGAVVFFLLWLAAAVLIVVLVISLLRWRAERQFFPVYGVFTVVSAAFTFLLASWGMFS